MRGRAEGKGREERQKTEELGHLEVDGREMEQNKADSRRTLELDTMPHTHPYLSTISLSQTLKTLMRPTSLQTRKKRKRRLGHRSSAARGAET